MCPAQHKWATAQGGDRQRVGGHATFRVAHQMPRTICSSHTLRCLFKVYPDTAVPATRPGGKAGEAVGCSGCCFGLCSSPMWDGAQTCKLKVVFWRETRVFGQQTQHSTAEHSIGALQTPPNPITSPVASQESRTDSSGSLAARPRPGCLTLAGLSTSRAASCQPETRITRTLLPQPQHAERRRRRRRGAGQVAAAPGAVRARAGRGTGAHLDRLWPSAGHKLEFAGQVAQPGAPVSVGLRSTGGGGQGRIW